MQATPPPPPPPSTPSFKNDNEDEDGVKKKIEIIEQRERTKTIEKLQAQQIDSDEEYLFKYSVIIWSTLAFSNIRISMWLSSFFINLK